MIMKFEQFVNERKQQELNEGAKAKKLVKAWMDMDIMNPGSEEEDLVDYYNQGKSQADEVWMEFGNLTSKMDDSEKDQYAAALEILFEGKKSEVKEEDEKKKKDSSCDQS